ncbi:unnamed protein product, partial [Musa banksii]
HPSRQFPTPQTLVPFLLSLSLLDLAGKCIAPPRSSSSSWPRRDHRQPPRPRRPSPTPWHRPILRRNPPPAPQSLPPSLQPPPPRRLPPPWLPLRWPLLPRRRPSHPPPVRWPPMPTGTTMAFRKLRLQAWAAPRRRPLPQRRWRQTARRRIRRTAERWRHSPPSALYLRLWWSPSLSEDCGGVDRIKEGGVLGTKKYISGSGRIVLFVVF